MILSVPSGSIPCVASLAITWVNLPTVGGQPTQMYQSKQWACTRHSVHGRTEFYRTNWTIVVRVYYWTTVEWKELLPDSSLSHLDYESRIYDIGLCGTSMSGICYIIAEQYWEAWGLFWKRSVSLCILGVLFGFGCCVVCVVVCCVVLCVCWWHLDHFFTFSLLWGNRQSKQDVLMTVWASSAHGTGKKKSNGPWLFPAEDEVRAGDSCRHTWEPELVSSFHHDRFWTNSGVFLLCLWEGVVLLLFVVLFLLSMTFP